MRLKKAVYRNHARDLDLLPGLNLK